MKLVLVPAIIGAASLAGRRWGPAVSGWLVGLPFMSAPVIFFLALAHGGAFAADTAIGTLAGGLSLAAFCVSYHLIARRFPWPAAIAGSLIALGGANQALQYLDIPPVALLLAVTASLVVSLWIVSPRGPAADPPPVALPAWDIPARMLAATAFVLLITGVAPLVGPRLSGLAATFPLVAGTLTVFSHHQHGPDAASGVLRGLLLGLFAFAGFYGALIGLLVPAGVGLAFGAAILAALAVQGATLWIMRR
jgi:hypothetical protein